MLVMIKAILHERAVVLRVSMDFGKGLRRSGPWYDIRWSSWRKETTKTGSRIQNIFKLREISSLREAREFSFE